MLRQVYRRMVTVIHREEEHRLSRQAFIHLMFLSSAALGLAAVPLATLARWAQRSGPKLSPEPTGTPIAVVADLPPGKAMNFNFPTEKDPLCCSTCPRVASWPMTGAAHTCSALCCGIANRII